MTSTLSTALSGLRMSQQQISVISGNISNVGTPGYSRKILPQTTQVVEGRTIGVTPGTITRNVSLNLTRDLWTQVSSTSALDVRASYLGRVEQFHGPPDQELSIAAKLSELRDTFSALSDSPDDTFLLANTVNRAEDMAKKMNDFSDLINTLRNDVQDEMQSVVTRINDLLEQIHELNTQIKINTNLSRTTAIAEDQRDETIKELSGLIEISFFQRGDGVLVVQTNEGIELTGDNIEELYFNPSPLSPTTYYPDSAAGVFSGDPNVNVSAFDFTDNNPGGKLGGLITLRDETFPKQMAQLDELAFQIAQRFDAQGLRLYTDNTGSIPGDTAPDATTNPVTAVQYVGFASVIQVNSNIIADNTLLQRGTFGATDIDTGSNDVIRRVIENTFTNTAYQLAANTDIDTQVDLLNRGGDDLQTWLGLFSENTLEGTRDLSAFANVAALVGSANGALDAPNNTFDITFQELRTAPPLGPTTITIDLTNAAGQAGATAADQIVAEINDRITVGPPIVPAALGATASVGPNGEIVIETRGSYSVDGGTMGQTGLNFLGLADSGGNFIEPEDPYFDIQVGNNPSTRITIEPDDDHTDLLTKLGNVDGLAVDTVNFALDGLLRLRPGNDYDNPDFGGDLRITSGPFEVNGASYNAVDAVTGNRTGLDDGANVISALFGTYTGTGAGLQDATPLLDITYASETDGSLGTPPTLAFRETLLGPGANITTGVIGAQSIVDYGQKMVNEHAQEILLVTTRRDDEQALQDMLQTQLSNDSGVNLDEEMAHLITVQTAYGASARVITVIDELFQELLNTI